MSCALALLAALPARGDGAPSEEELTAVVEGRTVELARLVRMVKEDSLRGRIDCREDLNPLTRTLGMPAARLKDYCARTLDLGAVALVVPGGGGLLRVVFWEGDSSSRGIAHVPPALEPIVTQARLVGHLDGTTGLGGLRFVHVTGPWFLYAYEPHQDAAPAYVPERREPPHGTPTVPSVDLTRP